jgi:transposase-like protein
MEQTTRLSKEQHIHRSEDAIRKLIAEYKISSFTVKEYCADKGINTGTFYCWLSKYRNNKEKRTTSAFVPVMIKEEHAEGNLYAEYKGLKFYQPMSVDFFKALIG